MLLENVSVVVVGVVVVDKGAVVDDAVDAVTGGMGEVVAVLVVDRGDVVDEVVDEVTGGMGDVSVVAVVGPFVVEEVDCEVSVDPVAV